MWSYNRSVSSKENILEHILLSRHIWEGNAHSSWSLESTSSLSVQEYRRFLLNNLSYGQPHIAVPANVFRAYIYSTEFLFSSLPCTWIFCKIQRQNYFHQVFPRLFKETNQLTKWLVIHLAFHNSVHPFIFIYIFTFPYRICRWQFQYPDLCNFYLTNYLPTAKVCL